MSDTLSVLLMILIMIAVLIMTLFLTGVRMRKAADFILKDLERKKAFDPASAVELPYCKETWLRFGLRDFRPKALGALLQSGNVRAADGGRYYLQGPGTSGTEGGAA